MCSAPDHGRAPPVPHHSFGLTLLSFVRNYYFLIVCEIMVFEPQPEVYRQIGLIPLRLTSQPPDPKLQTPAPSPSK